MTTARCTHPRGTVDAKTALCRVCQRVRNIIRRVEREQKRLNDQHLTLGKRIYMGLA